MKNMALYQPTFHIAILLKDTNLEIVRDQLFSTFQELSILLSHKKSLHLFKLHKYQF